MFESLGELLDIETMIRQASNTQFFQGGLLLGLLAYIGMELRQYPPMIWRRIRRYFRYVVYFDQGTEDSDFYEHFNRWYSETYPGQFRNVHVIMQKQAFSDDHYQIDSEGNITFDKEAPIKEVPPFSISNKLCKYSINLKQNKDTNYIWYKGRRLTVNKRRIDLQNASTMSGKYIDAYEISGWFAKKQINQLIKEVKEYAQRNQKEKSDGEIYIQGLNSYHGNGFQEYGQTSKLKGFDKLFYKNKHELIRDLDSFIESSYKYKELGIKFKRGYGLYGPPGTGKTATIYAMAKYLNSDLYIINLSQISSDQNLVAQIGEIPRGSIIALEDIDTMIKERHGEKDKKNISFNALLNCLDGAYSPEDVIFVITTNNLDALDEALIRAGRIDFMMEINFPRTIDVVDMINSYYEQDIGLKQYFDVNVNEVLPIPMSEVQTVLLDSKLEDAIDKIKDRINGKGEKR